MKKQFLYLLFPLLLLVGCDKSQSSLFEKALEYEHTQRDSLLWYLQQIESPEKLSAGQQARFGLLQANLFSLDKKDESLLDYAIRYYTAEEDTVMLVDCYLAKSQLYQDSLPQKIVWLEKAKDLAGKQSNRVPLVYICLRLAQSHYDMGEAGKAFDYLKEAEQNAPHDDYSYALAHWHQSSWYQGNAMPGQAIESLLKVIGLVETTAPQMLSPAYQQLSVIYAGLQQYEEAFKYINLSIAHRKSLKEAPTYNLTKGKIFLHTQELDSARRYLNYAIESPDAYVASRALGALSSLNYRINQYDKAYFSKLNEIDNFYSLLRQEESDVLQQKYLDEKWKNENNQLKIAKQRQENYSLTVTIVLLVVFITAYMLYLSKKKQQTAIQHRYKEQLLQEKNRLYESQNLLLKKENEFAILQQKAAGLRASLFKKMSLAEKIPSLNKEGEAESSAGRIRLTEQDLIELRKTVDTIYNDFSRNLSEGYPELTEDDIVFCCLIKIQVNMQDLSDIYCVSKAGITKRKMRLKKGKLKIETDMSLDEFIFGFS